MTAYKIESAKSGRSTCRTCREGIAKGDLRFGEETANAYSEGAETMFVWHHLRCAAKKKPSAVRAALATFEGELPGRDEIEAIIEGSKLKDKPLEMPYAERAPTARSRCRQCHELIAKGDLRVAVMDEPTGAPMPAPRYLHARCAKAAIGGDDLLDVLAAHSTSLDAEGKDELARQLEGG